MIILQAIFLGIVEGLTEFLPISSTGHVIVAERAVRYKDSAELFTVVIQIGAIAAVVWYYRRDIAAKIAGFFRRDAASVRFILNLIIACVPVIIVAALLDSVLQTWAVPATVAMALIIGGVILWLVETFHTAPKPQPHGASLERITPKQALGIGAAQVVSLIPGTSRSGATIVGGLLAGLDRVTATTFSFYLAIPVMVLATGYKLVKEHHAIAALPGGALALLCGTAAAFITGLFAVKWLLGYISSHDFKPFAYYRIGMGMLILFLLAVGWL